MIPELLARATAVDLEYIRKVANSASYRYKTYTIPKRDGSLRAIYHPARELKLFQGWVAKHVVSRLPVHEAATAYRPGKSILSNALLHVKQNYLLRIDFENFFPSITAQDVEALLKKNAEALKATVATDEDVKIIVLLCCRHGRLTIGAPSSPAISNAVMFDLDRVWFDMCHKRGIVYSRYADDLYFSTNSRDVLSEVLVEVRRDLGKCEGPKLFINNKKTIFTSRKRKRLATGLVLTSDRNVSLGRGPKRKIKALMFKFSSGTLEDPDLKYVRGFLAYANSVEPDFVESLRRKYGEEVVSRLIAGGR